MKKYSIVLVVLASICILTAVIFEAAEVYPSPDPAVSSESPTPNGNSTSGGTIIARRSPHSRPKFAQTVSARPAPMQILFTGQSSQEQLDAAQEIAAEGTEEAAGTLADFIAKAEESWDSAQQQLAQQVAAVLRQMSGDAALPMMRKLAYHRSELVSQAAVDAAVAEDSTPVEVLEEAIEPTVQFQVDAVAQALLDDLIGNTHEAAD